MPVRVMVSTVVVRSGTARRRATAFWIPMARASSAAMPSRAAAPGSPAVSASAPGHQDQFGRCPGAQQQAAVPAQPPGQRAAA